MLTSNSEMKLKVLILNIYSIAGKRTASFNEYKWICYKNKYIQ